MPQIRVIDVEDRWDANNEDEYLWWPRVLWIDPGEVSGVAIFWFDPVAVFNGEPLPRQLLAYSEMYLSGPENGLNGQVNRFLRIRRTLAQEIGLVTGSESFIMRTGNMDPVVLSPSRIRAAIEYQLSVTPPPGQTLIGEGVPLFTQSPSDAMNTFTNARLKDLRLYTPGPDHLNDAKRHGLLWIRKIRAAGVEVFKQYHGNEEDWWK